MISRSHASNVASARERRLARSVALFFSAHREEKINGQSRTKKEEDEVTQERRVGLCEKKIDGR